MSHNQQQVAAKAYGFNRREMYESDVVYELFKLYRQLTETKSKDK